MFQEAASVVLKGIVSAVAAGVLWQRQIGNSESGAQEVGMHLTHSIAWQQVRETFQKIWGYSDFRPPQGEIISSLLTQQDTLIVMPTGGGKSICFQLPALLQTGLTLVVSPLVALMENQVQELQRRGLPAAALHSELSSSQRRNVLSALEKQRLRLLYLSPETLLNETVWQRLCQPELVVNGLILDEAHCLVQWGDTFRPAHRQLGMVRPALLKHKPAGTKIAIAAFTATADPQAQQVIREVLQLQQPTSFLLNPYRPNLALSTQTVWTPRGRRQALLRYIQAHPHQSGLVYVRSRRNGEELASWLAQQGYQTAAYHAGLSPAERRRIEAAWLSGAIAFVVCTCAFGMGIDKPDVRWVIHFHMPLLLSEYVQEVGRAGRDGNPAAARMLVSEPTGWLDSTDRQQQQFFLEKARSQHQTAQRLIHKLPKTGNAAAVSRQFKDGAIALALLHRCGQLQWQDPFHYKILPAATAYSFRADSAAQKMADYPHSKICRWKFLLDAFGFTHEAASLRCGQCDRCLSQRSPS